MRNARSVVEPGQALPVLGDTLEFMRLIWAIDHGLQKTSKRMAASIGLTGPQRLVIRILGRFPGTSAGRLASTLHIDPSTLTGVLKRLERKGLISRRTDPHDRRRTTLGLTRRGLALDMVAAGTIETAVERALVGLPSRRIWEVRDVLRRLAEQLGVRPDALPPKEGE
jgi:MarR family transcriptional regulator, organic hydroperoxide resistance regulator